VSLQELVKIRASQINQCAYCIDMHSKDARAHGETEQRVYGLAAWREAPYYTDRERAALGLTEAVTLIGIAHSVPDDVLAEVERQFSSDEVIALLYAVVCINAWNRLGIAGRLPVPGSYEPRQPRPSTDGASTSSGLT